MDQTLEKGWKWVLRAMGVAGFIYLAFKDEAPVAFYVLLAGLLGLPNVIAYQISANRASAEEAAHEEKHGYIP